MVVERSTARIHRGDDVATRVLLAWLRDGRPVEFVAKGASMWPAVRAGATVRVQPCDARSLRPGDLGAFEHAGLLVVHRVWSADARGLVFRGDALGEHDGRVADADVLGRAEVVRQPAPRLVLPRARHVVAAARAVRAVVGAYARRWAPGLGR